MYSWSAVVYTRRSSEIGQYPEFVQGHLWDNSAAQAADDVTCFTAFNPCKTHLLTCTKFCVFSFVKLQWVVRVGSSSCLASDRHAIDVREISCRECQLRREEAALGRWAGLVVPGAGVPCIVTTWCTHRLHLLLCFGSLVLTPALALAPFQNPNLATVYMCRMQCCLIQFGFGFRIWQRAFLLLSHAAPHVATLQVVA